MENISDGTKIFIEDMDSASNIDIDEWRKWFEEEGGKTALCIDDSHCVWINDELQCKNKSERMLNAPWFNRGKSQLLGECSCPESFNLGFNWREQRCVSTQEQWSVVFKSIFICLALTSIIFLLAFLPEILVHFGFKKKRKPTPRNSSIRSNSSFPK